MSAQPNDLSSLTVNRLSIYLRCLLRLQQDGVRCISSKELHRRFGLSSALFRKDLALLGDLGIRGIGYDVDELVAHLRSLLGLDRVYRLVVVGMGNLGRALVGHLGTGDRPFRVVAAVDKDPAKVGTPVGDLEIRPREELADIVAETGADIGVLAVPAEVAQENYDALVAAGIRSVLNFAPAHLRRAPEVRTKNVDVRIPLEELGFFLRREEDG